MARTFASVLGLGLVTAWLVGCEAPPQDGAGTQDAGSGRHSAEVFFNTTSFSLAGAGGHAFSADTGQLLISSDETGVFNAYRLDPETGAREALTQSTDNAVFAVSWFPADGRALVTMDGGGDELNHVYVRELDGTLTDLTPGENVKASFSGWSADGAQFWITTNERDPAAFDLYVYLSLIHI